MSSPGNSPHLGSHHLHTGSVTAPSTSESNRCRARVLTLHSGRFPSRVQKTTNKRKLLLSCKAPALPKPFAALLRLGAGTIQSSNLASHIKEKETRHMPITELINILIGEAEYGGAVVARMNNNHPLVAHASFSTSREG